MTRPLLSMAVAALLAVLAVPAPGIAQGSAAQEEVRQVIRNTYAYSRENLMDAPDTYSAEGALEFWSSGGLLQTVPANAPRTEYESDTITPKHIEVILLAGAQVAVAQFYAEGAFQVKGQAPVADYVTRVTQVFVKEGGEWKVRAAHYSPIVGGSGTTQRALEN